MNYFYEKITIEELDTNKIIYYKLSKDKQAIISGKKITLINNFEDTIVNKETPLREKDFINIVKLAKKIYLSLKKKNIEYKTLDSATLTCKKHLDIDINYARGILLENGVIVIFNDFSESQKGYLESIIQKGDLV